jgi:hypothetical protein
MLPFCHSYLTPLTLLVSYEGGVIDPMFLFNDTTKATPAVASNESPLPEPTSTEEDPEVERGPEIPSERPSRQLRRRSGKHAPTQEAGDGVQTRNAPCPRLSSQDEVERAVELARLLKTAEDNGADAREPDVSSLVRIGNNYQCQACGKLARRDRLLSHFQYKHRELKTWTCPLWYVRFH